MTIRDQDHVPLPSPPDYYAFAARKKQKKDGDEQYEFEYMNRIIRETPNAKLLEVGCGMDAALGHLDPSVSYVGIDSEPLAVAELSKRHPSQRFVEGYAESLPFEDASFDIIFSCQALEMFHDPKKALQEIMRVVSHGGSVVIIALNFENPFSRVNAVRPYRVLQRPLFTARRIVDTLLRLFGILSFRTISRNVVQARGDAGGSYRYLPDDDAKYVTSAYEVATLFRRNGYSLIYHGVRRPSSGAKEWILRVLTRLPAFKYYGGGMHFIFYKTKLIALMRVKNGLPYIRDAFVKLSSLADEIIVVDNGSTDGTQNIYGDFPKIVSVLHTEGYDQGRDSTLLLEEAKKRNPDWIIKIDQDEVFEKHLTRKVFDRYMKSSYDAIRFRMYNFWMNTRSFRIDHDWLLYTLQPQRTMWRHVPSAYFTPLKVHGDIEGIGSHAYISPYRIKHYGYADERDARRKFRMYQALDPDNVSKYDHANPDVHSSILLPFLEFHSRAFNTTHIIVNNFIADVLWWLVKIKRKHFKKLKFFS